MGSIEEGETSVQQLVFAKPVQGATVSASASISQGVFNCVLYVLQRFNRAYIKLTNPTGYIQKFMNSIHKRGNIKCGFWCCGSLITVFFCPCELLHYAGEHKTAAQQ